MSTSSSIRNISAIATVSLLAGYSLYSYFTSSSSTNTCSDKLLPAIHEDECLNIMNDIHTRVSKASKAVMLEIQKFQQQLASQGQQVNIDELVKYFLPKLEQAVSDIEKSVCDEYNVEPTEIEDAYNYYSKNNDEIKKPFDQVRAVFQQFGVTFDDETIAADDSSSSSSGSSKISTEVIVQIIMSLDRPDIWGGFIRQFVETYGVDIFRTMQGQQMFDQAWMSLNTDIQHEVVKNANISDIQFQSAIENAIQTSNVEVIGAMQVIQKKQEDFIGSILQGSQ